MCPPSHSSLSPELGSFWNVTYDITNNSNIFRILIVASGIEAIRIKS
ncbi:15478_t:CDS:1, partial [Gigaspora margarita]